MDIASPEQLGAVIKNQRKFYDMTQMELAEKVGVSRLWINQIEKGKENASFQLILRTLNALDLRLKATERDMGRSQINLVFEEL